MRNQLPYPDPVLFESFLWRDIGRDVTAFARDRTRFESTGASNGDALAGWRVANTMGFCTRN